MDQDEGVLSRLCAVLSAHATVATQITGDTELARELGVDSAQMMEVLLEIEDEFDISIPLNVLPNIYTVNDLSREIERIGSGK